MAIALPLLVASGLERLGVNRFLNGPQGYDPDGAPDDDDWCCPRAGIPMPPMRAALRRRAAVERLAAVPGVEHAAAVEHHAGDRQQLRRARSRSTGSRIPIRQTRRSSTTGVATADVFTVMRDPDS